MTEDARRVRLSRKSGRIAAVTILFMLSSHGFAGAAPVEPKDFRSKGVCTSLNPETGQWGDAQAWPHREPFNTCPRGYAIMSSAADAAIRRPARQITVMGACCELPPGALTGTSSWTEEACPDDAVVTGVRVGAGSASGDYNYLVKEIRCTTIERSRFRLGNEIPGLRVTEVSSFPSSLLVDLGLSRESQVPFSSVPPALRYGLARPEYFRWDEHACIALPWGSLLVAKHGYECSMLSFRTLQYAGAPGDPPAGSPVNLLADCDALDDIFSAQPKCLHYPAAAAPR